jgi:RNA polymerase sigma-70 factor (ECF subfamily)
MRAVLLGFALGCALLSVLSTASSPAEHAETADSLSLAFLAVLDSLSPQQRTEFLLREVFEYLYADVAEIIGTNVDSTRHMVARAHNHVQERRPRYYAEQGDLRALEALLPQDVAPGPDDADGKVTVAHVLIRPPAAA